MSRETKVPEKVIEVRYHCAHSAKGIKRTIFVYAGEDVNVHLSKAWRTDALSAEIKTVATSTEVKLRPDKIEGEWNVQS
jgi:hypothetical protein